MKKGSNAGIGASTIYLAPTLDLMPFVCEEPIGCSFYY